MVLTFRELEGQLRVTPTEKGMIWEKGPKIQFTFLVLERLNFYMGLSLSSKMIPGDFNSKAVLKKAFAQKGLIATLYLLICYSITIAHTAMFKLGTFFYVLELFSLSKINP